MKAIVCEMCGSQDLVKQDGMYVCQNCGTKYDPKEAKKLMVEVAQEEKVSVEKKDNETTAKKPIPKKYLAVAGIVLTALIVILIVVFNGKPKTPFDKIIDYPDSKTVLSRLGNPTYFENESNRYSLVLRYDNFAWNNYRGRLSVFFKNDIACEAIFNFHPDDYEKSFADITKTLNKRFNGNEGEQYEESYFPSSSKANEWADKANNTYRLWIDFDGTHNEEIMLTFN